MVAPIMSNTPTTSSHHHHSSPNVIRTLLSALAFETAFPSLRKPRTTPFLSTTSVSMSDRQSSDLSSSEEGSPGNVNAHSLVHGMIDASGDSIEVFFDAAEEDLPCHYKDFSHGVVMQEDDDNNVMNVRGGTDNNSMMKENIIDLASINSASMSYFTPRQSPCPEDEGQSNQHDDNSSRHHHHHHGIPPPPLECGYDKNHLFPTPPSPPDELPERFLRATKGDREGGQRRYEETLQWRREVGMDTILQQPHEHFEFIKQHYPHFFHFKGHNGEPVFYELPPKTNLKALRAGGVTVPMLLRHYAMVTEFGWQYLERDDFARSIYIIDLDGIRMTDFAGECVDFVRKASDFTSAHYPERAGTVIIINVPSWFKLIWNVVKAWIDEVTLQKICILRGREEIVQALADRIPLENIPKEYGGTCPVPLGESPEEELMQNLMRHNNERAEAVDCGGPRICNGLDGHPPCPFCSFCPARTY